MATGNHTPHITRSLSMTGISTHSQSALADCPAWRELDVEGKREMMGLAEASIGGGGGIVKQI